MRLKITLSPNAVPVRFNYQAALGAIFRKWSDGVTFGEIALHGFSWLENSTVSQGALEFPTGSVWQIGTFNKELLANIAASAVADPRFFAGMEVLSTEFIRPPALSENEQFYALSPILARGEGGLHLHHKNPMAGEIITANLRHRLDKAGLRDVHLDSVRFENYPRAKTKLVIIGPRKYKASICPVTVSGQRAAVQFAWSCGVGHGTNNGFGWLEQPTGRK